MPLIQCLECGQDISDQAPTCPHCGYVFMQQSNAQNVLLNQVPDLNIEKIVKTGKQWKELKVIAWIGGIIGIFMAIGGDSGSFLNTLGWIVVIVSILLYIYAKFANWWERG